MDNKRFNYLGAAGMVNGYAVCETENMTKNGEPYEIRRSLKERLFSLPWRPLTKTITVIPQIPSDEIIRDDINMRIYGHPETIKQLIAAIDSYN